METGSCSACGASAFRAPSGNWYHRDEPCPARSALLFEPVYWMTTPDGRYVIGPQTADRMPARFVPACADPDRCDNLKGYCKVHLLPRDGA